MRPEGGEIRGEGYGGGREYVKCGVGVTGGWGRYVGEHRCKVMCLRM